MRKIIFIIFLLICSNVYAVYDLNLQSSYTAQAGVSTTADLTTEDCSWSFRFKLTDTGDNEFKVVANKGSVSAGCWLIGRGNDVGNEGTMFFMLSGWNWYFGTNTAYQDSNWHHCAIVIDRDSQSNCKIYIDGTSVAVTYFGTLALTTGSMTNAEKIKIGNYSGTDPSNRRFDGQIYDFKYWIGGIWTTTEISYQNSHPLDVSASAGTLTDYWLMQEGSGTDINAGVSTPTNDLVLSNALAWDSFVTTQIKKIVGVAYADVKKVVGVAIASVKKVGGVQ
jgi:hypothetical protein